MAENATEKKVSEIKDTGKRSFYFDLNEVEEAMATIDIGDGTYKVRSLADLPFAKMSELTSLYSEIAEDQEKLADKASWDNVKAQILILIPDLSSEEFEKQFTIRKVAAFLEWHGDLSQQDTERKNEDGASD